MGECQSMAGNLAIASYGHLERDRAGVLCQQPSTVGTPHERLGDPAGFGRR
jgi:hypothetical protein